jgi:flagellar biosynthesis anti-sigma factor FlgM
MKITQRSPADTDLSQRVQNDKSVNQLKKDSQSKIQQAGESAKVNISKEARELQRIAELARTGDELRAQKVNDIKEQIAKGEYSADPVEVSKSIVRSEVSRILEDK